MRNTQSRITGSRRLQRGKRAQEILLAYRKSGLTQRVFAREAGIGVSTLQLWLRQARLKAEGPAQAERPARDERVSLLEVDVQEFRTRIAPEKACYELRLGNGARLRLGEGFEEEAVRRLLGLLQEVRVCSPCRKKVPTDLRELSYKVSPSALLK
jgi:hypothetical protein